jgi:hypothetical protein
MLNPGARTILIHEMDHALKVLLALQGPDSVRNFATLSQKVKQLLIGLQHCVVAAGLYVMREFRLGSLPQLSASSQRSEREHVIQNLRSNDLRKIIDSFL